MQSASKYPDNQWCIAAFSISDQECARVIVSVAEEEGSPVALCIDADHVEPSAVEVLSASAISMAERATVRVAVTFSHARSLDLVRRALDLGFSTVMFDGSFLPFPSNVALTARAADMAHRAGVSVEGEIGAFDDFGKDSSGQCLICSLAETFSRETGIDSLAVSIPLDAGSKYCLDMEVLDKLRRTVTGGLTLHDASLLAHQDILRAVSAGVTKLSFTVLFKRTFTIGVSQARPGNSRLGETVRQWLQLLNKARLAAPFENRTLT